ncbi:glycosyl transferase family, a/b domain-containing protein [Morchella snyderi]|nr:glycosyl transferase family, a/b domain-containing protein [Morchella snyderi]
MAAPKQSILPLLKALSTARSTVTPDLITSAIALSFRDELSPAQAAALLTALHFTGLDQHPAIIAAAATAMRAAGLSIPALPTAVHGTHSAPGSYGGGLEQVDIVGTGGDGHNTFNVSTTSAILASGCGLRICKHGNKASTSTSGSADILTSLGAHLSAVTPPVVADIFAGADANFCFLFAPVYHPGVRHVAGIRRELGFRTIFNLLGPLVNPVDYSVPGGLEARIIGVGKRELGAVFAETLRLLGCRKGMVVCGEEGLDEVSCEGRTECWRLVEESGEVAVDHFWVHPAETFGLGAHPLSDVAGGKSAAENAVILERLLTGKGVESDRPVKEFILVNTAALLVVAGAAGEVERVPEGELARGEVWKRAVKRAEEAMGDGSAWKEWCSFVEVSSTAAEAQKL